MTPFEKLVKQMREAQRRYFRLEPGPEKQEALSDSKQLDRAVDKAITEKEEGSLFG